MNGLPRSGAPTPAPAPPVPAIAPGEWYAGSPYPVTDSVSPTIGWQNQPQERGGPVFVVITRSALGGRKVAGRYPLTEDGWAHAWQALDQSSPQAAARIRHVLAGRPAAGGPPQPPAPICMPDRRRQARDLIVMGVAGMLGLGLVIFAAWFLHACSVYCATQSGC